MLNGRSTEVIVIGAVFLVIALVSVAMRCCVRTKIVHKTGYDDALLITAAAFNIGFFGAGTVAVSYGLGSGSSTPDDESKGKSKALLVCG